MSKYRQIYPTLVIAEQFNETKPLLKGITKDSQSKTGYYFNDGSSLREIKDKDYIVVKERFILLLDPLEFERLYEPIEDTD